MPGGISIPLFFHFIQFLKKMEDTTSSNSDVAARHNIIHKRGDSLWRGWEFYSDAAYTIPIDITSSTFKMTVKSADRLREIFSFDIGSGLTITDTNKLELDLAEMADTVKAGAYIYDMQKTLSSGRVTTILEGDFILTNDVSPA